MHARITSDCDFQMIRLEIEYPLGGGHRRPHLATMHRSTEVMSESMREHGTAGCANNVLMCAKLQHGAEQAYGVCPPSCVALPLVSGS